MGLKEPPRCQFESRHLCLGAALASPRAYLTIGILRSVDGDRHCGDEHDTEDDVLRENVDAEKRHPDPHHRDDQRADQRAPDAAHAAGDRRAAHHHRRDRRQQHLRRQRRRAAGQPPGEDHAGQRGEGGGEHVGDHLLPVHLDARGIGGRLAGADGGAVAAEAGVGLQHMRDHEHDQADHHHVRDAEGGAGDPVEIAALGNLERDRLLPRGDERGARRARPPSPAWR